MEPSLCKSIISTPESTARQMRALSVTLARQGSESNGLSPLTDSATVAELELRGGAMGAENLLRDSANANTGQGRISLSVGDPSDYTDEELEAMMARLDKWDGSASADPLPTVPILPPGS